MTIRSVDLGDLGVWPSFERNGSRVIRKNAHGPLVGVKGSSGVTFVGSPDWRNVIYFDGQAHPDAEQLTRAIAMATSAYAYSATFYRATKVGEPPLMVVQETEDGDMWLPDHPLGELLDEPSPDYDMGVLIQITEMYLLGTGRALWVKEVDQAGRVARIIPYSGEEFETKAANGLIYGLYVVRTGSGTRYYTPEQVVSFRDVNPRSWREGLAKIDVALAALNLGHVVDRTVRNFMRRAMFPGGIISPDKDWDPDEQEWEAYVNQIEAWNAGPSNAGAPLVLLGDTKFSRAAVPLKELLPTEIVDRVETIVSSVYGVPPVVLGWKVGLENSPWSQMSEARLSVYEETIIPRWRIIEKAATKSLLSSDELAQGMRIVFDTSNVSALKRDDSKRATIAVQMERTWTLNERRVYTGQEPIEGDEGDVIGTGAPSFLSLELPKWAYELDEYVDLLDVAHHVKGISAGSFMFRNRGGRFVRRNTRRGSIQRGKTILDDKTVSWAIFDIATKASEASFERAARKWIGEAKARMDVLIESLEEEKAVDPSSAKKLLDQMKAWLKKKGVPRFDALMSPLISSTAETGVRAAAAGIGVAFTRVEPHLAGYAGREAARLAKLVGDSTAEMITHHVQASLEGGETLGRMIKRLTEGGQFARSRAKLIARTESTRAWNGGATETMKSYASAEDVQMIKEWATAGDDRVRDEHVDLEGERVKIDDAFSNGLDHPEEPNCRCTLLFHVE